MNPNNPNRPPSLGRLPDLLEQIWSEHEEFGVFVGSAVSVWKPSALPTAQGLRDAVIESLANPEPLLGPLAPAAVSSLRCDRRLRLEAVLEEVERHVPGASEAFLGVLQGGEPNSLHLALADWFVRGRASVLYTTNQDLLFERALQTMGYRPGTEFQVVAPSAMPKSNLRALIKLHGSTDIPGSTRATFSQVGQQLPSDLAARLQADLSRLPFIVLGYSGLDIDVRPVFRRAELFHTLWLERPGALTSGHFALQLQSDGKRITPVGECDLSDLPTLWGSPRLELGADEGERRARELCRHAAIELCGPGVAAFVVSRISRHAEGSVSVSLRRAIRERSCQGSDIASWHGRWRLDFDIGEDWLRHAGMLVGSVRSGLASRRALRAAQEAGDYAGQVHCLRAIGMAVDLSLLGLARFPYRLSREVIYPRAMRILRRLPRGIERSQLQDNIDLLVARADLRVGRRRAASRRFRRLSTASASGFVRAHALRFLALLNCVEGRYDAAETSLGEAEEEFGYMEAQTELLDVKRVRTIVAMHQGRLSEALVLGREALLGYQRTADRRGSVRMRLILGLLQGMRILPFVRRMRLIQLLTIRL